MAYTKEQMVYHDYYWAMAYTAGDPHITGDLDDTVLRRTAGKEMLYFINECAEDWRWGGHLTKGFRKLEKVVRDIVPKGVQTQREIKQWMGKNLDAIWSEVEVEEMQ